MGLVGMAWLLRADGVPTPTVQRMTNGDVQIQYKAAAGTYCRIETSTDLLSWASLVTAQSTGTVDYTDGAAPYFPKRFYRAKELAAATLTGDHLATSAGEVVIHPVNHASFVMSWNGKMIYNDPVGASALYSGFAKADLILVSHDHGDHYSNTTLAAVLNTGGKIIAPQAVYNSMTTALKAATTVLANGASTTAIGVTVDAIPAYNANHPLGTGNGYVVTLGGKRIYMSGDTGAIAETRTLPNIDVAFLCMNVPFTMTVAAAASVTRDFRPKAIYPYHYRNQDNSLADLADFKAQVGTDLGIEVRLRTWY
jgi:L-ascorbate metabolism protein UlaG (beta-lactamase superfamily)